MIEHFVTQINEPTNQNSIKVLIYVKSKNKKMLLTLGTSVMNRPMFISFLPANNKTHTLKLNVWSLIKRFKELDEIEIKN